eukprot:2622891-Rhodomonas_salina.2
MQRPPFCHLSCFSSACSPAAPFPLPPPPLTASSQPAASPRHIRLSATFPPNQTCHMWTHVTTVATKPSPVGHDLVHLLLLHTAPGPSANTTSSHAAATGQTVERSASGQTDKLSATGQMVKRTPTGPQIALAVASSCSFPRGGAVPRPPHSVHVPPPAASGQAYRLVEAYATSVSDFA